MFTFATSVLYGQGNSRRTFSAMLVKANRNSHCGGIPLLGYDIVDRSLQVNEREAEAVRLIFDMCELNHSYSKIADILNERGYRTKAGTLFKKQSFYPILRQKIRRYLNKCENDINNLKSANLKSIVTSFGNTLKNSDDPEIHDFLQANIASIIVGNDDITITFNVA